jgi:hypothetical protein
MAEDGGSMFHRKLKVQTKLLPRRKTSANKNIVSKGINGDTFIGTHTHSHDNNIIMCVLVK